MPDSFPLDLSINRRAPVRESAREFGSSEINIRRHLEMRHGVVSLSLQQASVATGALEMNQNSVRDDPDETEACLRAERASQMVGFPGALKSAGLRYLVP